MLQSQLRKSALKRAGLAGNQEPDRAPVEAMTWRRRVARILSTAAIIPAPARREFSDPIISDLAGVAELAQADQTCFVLEADLIRLAVKCLSIYSAHGDNSGRLWDSAMQFLGHALATSKPIVNR